jgi:3-dehydroquinate synthase class II
MNKPYRNIRVAEQMQNEKWVPLIRLQGHWLAAAGIKPGDQVIVKVENGKLEIVKV